MGPGGSQEEAEFTLRADIPAGTYHVIFDAIIIQDVDVTFTMLARTSEGDTTLAEWTHHFVPVPGDFSAQVYELDVVATSGIEAGDGNQFVLRYAGNNASIGMAFIPNGEGANADGRIPNITLPK
ncbi:MAG: hypothetical protein AB7O24_29765 [Kofleriaceae bacterium]